MEHRNIISTQRNQNRCKSKTINQSSLGRKILTQTNICPSKNIIPILSPKNGAILKISVSPKNKNQPKPDQRKKQNNNILQRNKNEGVIKDLLTKNVQNKQTQKESQNKLKISAIQIECPMQDQTIDDEMNLLCTSNYPKKVANEFLQDTHLKNNLSKSTYTKLVQPNNERKSLTKARILNSEKIIQTTNQAKKDTSKNKNLRLTQQKVSLQKSKRKIENSFQPAKQKLRQISKTKKRTLSNTKISSKQRQSSAQTKGNSSNKNKLQPIIKSTKILLPKEIPKPKNQKTKQKQDSQKKIPIENKSKDDENQSQATKSPSFEELQKLRLQNQRYKIFLASSAFKLEELKKQIEEHKQIRQKEKHIYNFQLNNLRKQLDCNKKQIGHLFSYDEPTLGNQYIPDQIIIETDNESSSVHESLHIINQKMKSLGLDDQSGNSSQKIRKTNQSNQKNFKFNPSSFNQNQQPLQGSSIEELIKNLQNDLTNQEAANLKFLSQIQKIPSLEIKLSFQQSEKLSKLQRNQNQSQSFEEAKRKDFFKNKNNYSSFQCEDSSGGFLLLSSIGK